MFVNNVINRLGKPYFPRTNCLIYQRDCLEVIGALADESMDLTVTSPPDNIGKDYEKSLPLNEYLSWCSLWIAEVYRLTGDREAFWVNLGYLSIPNRAKAIPLPYLLWDKIPFYLIQEIIWNYGAGVVGKKFFFPQNEKFL